MGVNISRQVVLRVVSTAACRDCHTEQTVWPWYSRVAPMHWLTTADVYAGREHMNLSRWGRYRTGEQIAKLNAICDMVRKGKMPLWYYRPLNPSTSLSRDDVAELCAWTDAQMLDLSCQLSSAQRNITQFLRWSVSDDVQREGTAGFVDEESANAA
jgi:hypothetical protein